MNLFSLISLFSYFAFFAKGYPLPVKAAYLKYGGRPQSQPTRCGHTLTRCPLPGLGGGGAVGGFGAWGVGGGVGLGGPPTVLPHPMHQRLVIDVIF